MLAVAAVGLAVLMGVVTADVAGYVAAGLRASGAADAAALAAAPLTFDGFGGGGPRREAERFAARNGTEVVACTCSIDRSWRARTVTVVVATTVRLVLLGDRTVRAVGRAEFVPTMLH